MTTSDDNTTSAIATDADRIAKLQKQLEEGKRTIEGLERGRRIDDLLRETGAIDLETARVIVEHALNGIEEPEKADVGAIVADLKRRKSFLFAVRRGPAASGALAPRSGADVPAHVEHAAAEAHATGRRADLLRYLRLKRKRD